MQSYQQSDTPRNYFYPNCGCESQVDCVTCSHCGMCVTNAEHCACRALPLSIDQGLGFDPHQEILGG